MQPKNKVLIIEDCTELADLLEKFLKDKYYILKAGSEKEGYDILEKNRRAGEDISVILCDDSTIDYNANNFLETAGSEYISTIRILMLNLTSQLEAEQLKKEGLIHSYIAKPFQMAEAEQLVGRAVEARKKALKLAVGVEQMLPLSKLPEQYKN